MRSKVDCSQTNALVRRLLDLEVGDSIIHRYPGWMMADARREIGGLASYEIDEDTLVLTCIKKRKAPVAKREANP